MNSSKHLRYPVLALAFLLGTAAIAKDAPPSPARPPAEKKTKTKTNPKIIKVEPVIEEFLAAWTKTTNFEADFKQTTTYIAMEETETTAGHTWVKKPGRLRWDETTSSQKLSQILNGKRLTSISERTRKPGLRTIDDYENGLALLDKAAFGFLSERKPLTDSYDVSLQKQNGNTAWLILKPKAKPKEPLVAEISKPGYVLRALSTETPESRVRIEFSEVSTSKDIPEKIFEWTEDKEKDRVVRHK